MPSSRYKEIAPKVKAICEKYGLPYNTGPFRKQWLMVQRTILRLAFPGGEPRPKAPPYVAPPEVEDPGPVVHSARGPDAGVPVASQQVVRLGDVEVGTFTLRTEE